MVLPPMEKPKNWVELSRCWWKGALYDWCSYILVDSTLHVPTYGLFRCTNNGHSTSLNTTCLGIKVHSMCICPFYLKYPCVIRLLHWNDKNHFNLQLQCNPITLCLLSWPFVRLGDWQQLKTHTWSSEQAEAVREQAGVRDREAQREVQG